MFSAGAAAQTSTERAFPDTLAGQAYVARVGARVVVHHAPRDSLVAREVLSVLDRQSRLPGLPDSLPSGVHVYLTHGPEAFDEITGGAVPEWRAGVAIPSLNMLAIPLGEGTRILNLEGRRTLRHEWAHLGLAAAIDGLRAPRWFTEGYAQWASAGFDASEAWKLRVLMALSRTPPMDSLTLQWPRGRAQADVAYLLSASAVTYLLQESGERGLAIFVERWRDERSFESAFRRTFGVTTSQFEEDWKKHVKSRYGWLFVFSHSTLFWMLLALVLLFMLRIRRGRDREQMARLRAGEPPDQPAYWDEAEDDSGPVEPISGVDKEP
jgi:hypothetical protein